MSGMKCRICGREDEHVIEIPALTPIGPVIAHEDCFIEWEKSFGNCRSQGGKMQLFVNGRLNYDEAVRRLQHHAEQGNLTEIRTLARLLEMHALNLYFEGERKEVK